MSIVQMVALWAVPILLAITVHEVAHGWVARLLGDPTAYEAGRLTLNPIPHMHWFGTFVLPLSMAAVAGIAVGWAKPVPVNYARLHRPRQDMAWVAFAGPASNGLMLVGWAVLARFSMEWQGEAASALFLMSQAGIIINAALMLLNLLPIPPLDGSVILGSWLPKELSAKWFTFGRYGMFFALAVLFFGLWQGFLLVPLIAFIEMIHGAFGLSAGYGQAAISQTLEIASVYGGVAHG